MKKSKPEPTASEPPLSRREREMMDILFTLGRATGQEIQERLTGTPGYSGVRTILRILERKGHVRHIEEGLRYVYLPAIDRAHARRSAIERLIRTFFDGSAKDAIAAFLDPATSKLSTAEYEEIRELIRRARTEKE